VAGAGVRRGDAAASGENAAMTTELRPVSGADLPGVLDLNNAAVPAVNELSAEDLAWFSEHATLFEVAVDDAGLVGFLVGLTEGSAYGSANYAWFGDRYERFVYVDRIVVAERARGQGIARRLYDRLAAVGAAAGAAVMLAEVNLRPRNDVSLGFHERYGFRPVGEQDTEGGAKRVVMLEHVLSGAAGDPPRCDSCGDDSGDLVEVRRLYVRPADWDHEREVTPAAETEWWCFPCRTMYPHEGT
jgi:predicted GNAT superfamily acetyltransferase